MAFNNDNPAIYRSDPRTRGQVQQLNRYNRRLLLGIEDEDDEFEYDQLVLDNRGQADTALLHAFNRENGDPVDPWARRRSLRRRPGQDRPLPPIPRARPPLNIQFSRLRDLNFPTERYLFSPPTFFSTPTESCLLLLFFYQTLQWRTC